MRTKSVLLAALCGLVGASAVEAQSVYSVNAVGYVNTSFKSGVYKMFSNPLNTTNNTIANLIPNAPDASEIFIWTGSGYNIATYASFLGGWDKPTLTLNPGQGAFLLASADFTNTFVGEVMTGNLTNSFSVGYTIISSQVPQAVTFDTLGLTAVVQDADMAYRWNTTTGKYDQYTYASFLGGWSPSQPTLNVGESIFVNSATGGKITRSFSVN